MDEYKSEKIEELRSQLYYDLKDKYVKLENERDSLLYKLSKQQSKINKLLSALYPLRYGRKYFNFCVKLCKDKITKHAIKNNYDLETTCELIKQIEDMKQPIVTENNKKEMDVIFNLVEEHDKKENHAN